MKVKISEIKNTEPKREHGDINILVESIKKEGIREARLHRCLVQEKKQ